MIAIDKLIFNALASHSNVNMPGLGSLLSQRQPAKLKGRKTLTPPRNRMVFSYESLPLALNLVELIVRQTGDEPGARDLYEQWLN
ncbi:MAG: hypothetical protein LBU95_01435, partial [Rikenellaceae bacterium]|nr:hypothetical protein [Rikenellaceae bacterium]